MCVSFFIEYFQNSYIVIVYSTCKPYFCRLLNNELPGEAEGL